jgi:rhamnopyranosyl-N-acetylglucosaminyl-diphospho-decaprenol beta-1,3/1,4-galactofuranosyltransferase
MHITAIVVTYNRKDLLLGCLANIAAQTRKPDTILIVENASTDGTIDELRRNGWLLRQDVELLKLEENTGGAGGFASGMDHAYQKGTDWVWIMDDDAAPHPEALEKLVAAANDTSSLYGSVAINNQRLCWPMLPLHGDKPDEIFSVAELKRPIEVSFIPFLGLMISKEIIARIGIPDAGFFLYVDDVEYCWRARKNGAKIILVGDSHIEHPLSERNELRIGSFHTHTPKLAPWKRYYDVRNRLFVARDYYGLGLYYSTIPGSIVRYIATLLNQSDRWDQTRAVFYGMLDGLMCKKGRRHEHWNLH